MWQAELYKYYFELGSLFLLVHAEIVFLKLSEEKSSNGIRICIQYMSEFAIVMIQILSVDVLHAI
jgi:hypothetical protein